MQNALQKGGGASALPPFSLTTPQDDMHCYSGRCRYFYRTINPLICLETTVSLKEHQSLLDLYKRKELDATNEAVQAKLWYARQAIEACIHPSTHAVIPPPFRMAAFIPTNLFINPFSMLPSTVASPSRSVLIHWFNQSYNCLVNYNNRSSDAQPLWVRCPQRRL
jgi:sideroflexin-5